MCSKWYKPLVFSLVLFGVAPAYGMDNVMFDLDEDCPPEMQRLVEAFVRVGGYYAEANFGDNQDGSEENSEVDDITTSDCEVADNIYMQKFVELMSDSVRKAGKDTHNAYTDALEEIWQKHDERLKELGAKVSNVEAREEDNSDETIEAALNSMTEMSHRIREYEKFKVLLDEQKSNSSNEQDEKN